MSRVITICREFGSGGREVGSRVAEILRVPYYDEEIVQELSNRTQLALSYVNQFSESGVLNYFPITTGRSFERHVNLNPSALYNLNLHMEQSKLLMELAMKSDCVIVGRCANHILRDFKPLRVFIYASMESKIKRCKEKAHEHENLSDKELARHINEIDKRRAKYYKAVTDRHWADKGDYDIMLNTTNYPIALAAQIIAQKILFGTH